MLNEILELPKMFFTKWVPQLLNVKLGIFDEIPTLYKIIGVFLLVIEILRRIIKSRLD